MPSIIVAHFAILALLFTCVIAAPVVEDQTHELAVREPNTALSRNEADWQISFYQGGDWYCGGDPMNIQTTYPEFPENECVNLGVWTDSASFVYSGPGLCATVHADEACNVPLWQVTNVDQCYWGLPGQYIWIEYDCKPLGAGPKARRDREITAGEASINLVRDDPHPGMIDPPLHDAVLPNGPSSDLTPRSQGGTPTKTAAAPTISISLKDFAARSTNFNGTDGLSRPDSQAPFSLELYDDNDASVWDTGCRNTPLFPPDTIWWTNTCITVDGWISSGQFAFAESGYCVQLYKATICDADFKLWNITGVNQCSRGPFAWSFVMSPTCDFSAFGG